MGAKTDKVKDKVEKVADKVADAPMATTKGNVPGGAQGHLAATPEQITGNQAGTVPQPKDVGGNAKAGSKRDAGGDTSKTLPGVPGDAPDAATTATSAAAGVVKPLGGAITALETKDKVEPALQEMQKTRKDEPGKQTESKVLGLENAQSSGKELGTDKGAEGDLNLSSGKPPTDKVDPNKTVVPDTSNFPKKK